MSDAILKQKSVTGMNGISITYTNNGGVVISQNVMEPTWTHSINVTEDTTTVSVTYDTVNINKAVDLSVWYKVNEDTEQKIYPDISYTNTDIVIDFTGFPTGTYILKFSSGLTYVQTSAQKVTINSISHYDDTTGVYWPLDSESPMLEFFGRYDKPQRVRLRVKSADDTVSGNVSITPIVNGIMYPAQLFTISPNGEESWISFGIYSNDNVSLSFVRNYMNSSDTLKSSGVVITLMVVDAVYEL